MGPQHEGWAGGGLQTNTGGAAPTAAVLVTVLLLLLPAGGDSVEYGYRGRRPIVCDTKTTCAPTAGPSTSPSVTPTRKPSTAPTPAPTPAPAPQSWTGALVTSNCVYAGYDYAIDVYWSCGSEQWDRPLRLHTYKRHSYSDRAVFADQLITMRGGGQLWFDSYSTPRCVVADSAGDLQLSTSSGACTRFALSATATAGRYELKSGNRCVVITTSCGNRGWTGGRECGGVLHMYLPIRLQACSPATTTTFWISTQADYCASEYPGSSCF